MQEGLGWFRDWHYCREGWRLEIIRVAKGRKILVSQYEDLETGEGVRTIKGRRRQGKLCKRQKLDLNIQGRRLEEARRGCLLKAKDHEKEEESVKPSSGIRAPPTT